MKKFVRDFTLFLGFTAIFYPLILLLFGQFPKSFRPNLINNHTLFKIRLNNLKQFKNKIDVLVLGSSHVYRGFDPRNFKEKQMLVLGSSSQTHIQTKILLSRHLKKINPKIVIYEVFPKMFENDGVESATELISNDSNDMHSILMAWELNNLKVYNSLLYALCNNLLPISEKPSKPSEENLTDVYVPGGFLQKNLKYYKHQVLPKDKIWKFNPVQIEKFKDNIALLKKENIDILLVYAPITQSLYHSYVNNTYVDSFMTSFHLPYYNFNELISLDDSLDFFDDNHLNQNGVNKFNAAVNDVLQKH